MAREKILKLICQAFLSYFNMPKQIVVSFHYGISNKSKPFAQGNANGAG